jgi:heme-degrading monooxygenase HmoA
MRVRRHYEERDDRESLAWIHDTGECRCLSVDADPGNLPGIGSVKGYLGSYVLRRRASDEVEFITVLLWESTDAIRAVAGRDYEKAVIPQERRQFLLRYDETAAHYDVVSTQPPRPPAAG